jgi:flavin-binding protein dodecin
MKDHVFKLIELTGTSDTSIEEAVEGAVERAHRTVKHMSWFHVIDLRGNIVDGKIHHWQVTLKIGFTVEE